MQKHDVHTLIHGHTHRPDIHHFSIVSTRDELQQRHTRIVLSAWHQQGSALVWEEDGKYYYHNVSGL